MQSFRRAGIKLGCFEIKIISKWHFQEHQAAAIYASHYKKAAGIPHYPQIRSVVILVAFQETCALPPRPVCTGQVE